MIDIDFNKVDLAFPKVLAKKLNALKEAITDVIDDENVSLSTTYSSQKIMRLVAEFGFSIKVVDTLPARGRKNTIYLVPSSEEVHEYCFLTNSDGDILYGGNTTSTPNPEYRIGDIISPTIENPTSRRECRVISSVGPDFCDSEEGDGFKGITGTITWQKDHYYEITDIVEFKGAVTGDTLGKVFIFEEYDGTPTSFVECEELPGCFLYKQEHSQDIKDEYIWVNSQWEKIGSTRIDLSQYYTKNETDELLDKKVDKIYPTPLCFTAEQDNSSVGTAFNDSLPNIEISTDDGATWTTWDYTTIHLTYTGDKVYMRGMNPNRFNYYNYEQDDMVCYSFSMSGKIGVTGNIMSLIDYTKEVCTIPNEYCFGRLFANCHQSLTSAPELPATTLADSCYNDMFNGCTSLTSAPVLPATTLADWCYASMFNGCTSLTSAPLLPATTLADYCYNGMFNGCTSLTTAPLLPATTLATSCYANMFFDCSSLTTAPLLPATTLASLCYNGMFVGCNALNYIKCLAVNGINQNNSTTNWVNGVASTGTFVKDASASWPSSTNGIPIGWTVVNHYDNVALENKLATKVESETIKTIWSGTQAEYDAITTKSDNILYIIK